MQVIDMVTGKIITMEMPDILEEINRDRSEDWTNYDATDWREGWSEWVEGEYLSAIDEDIPANLPIPHEVRQCAKCDLPVFSTRLYMTFVLAINPTN